jgi:hypothetical protein
LRVGNPVIRICKIAAVGGAILPNNISGACIELADNIRSSVAIKHALSRDVCGSAAGELKDPTQLPALDRAGDNARAGAEQRMPRTNRQFEDAVRAKVVAAISDLKRVISLPINRVCVDRRRRTAAAKQFAPGI